MAAHRPPAETGVKSVLLSGSDTDRQRTAWLTENNLEVTLLGGQEIPTLRTWVGSVPLSVRWLTLKRVLDSSTPTWASVWDLMP